MTMDTEWKLFLYHTELIANVIKSMRDSNNYPSIKETSMNHLFQMGRNALTHGEKPAVSTDEASSSVLSHAIQRRLISYITGEAEYSEPRRNQSSL
jgi:hypothetical protein